MDYTTYPDGFNALIEDCEFPVETNEQKQAYMLALLDTLVKM